jgi:hypothetical protein
VSLSTIISWRPKSHALVGIADVALTMPPPWATEWCEDCTLPMPVTKPNKKQVLAAGKVLTTLDRPSDSDWLHALDAVNAWRAIHIVPMG